MDMNLRLCGLIWPRFVLRVTALWMCVGIGLLNTEAEASSKVALVIGNAAYSDNPLKNPTNDARAISKRLKDYGFEIIYKEDVKVKEIGRVLREFKQKIAPGGTALVFYAGHGLQIKGVNYLPAVDADMLSEEDVPYQSFSLDQILGLMTDAKVKTNIVMLDACRNNPFVRQFRSAGSGLASVSAPTGTLISYATRPGSVAADGEGENGLYTEVLLKAMSDSMPIEQVLKKVVVGVRDRSQGRQEPWSEGSLDSDFCFGKCIDLRAQQQAIQNEVQAWESIKGSSRAEDFEGYLVKYPSGLFSEIARDMVQTLRQEKAVSTLQNDAQERESRSQATAQSEAEKKRLEKLASELAEREKALKQQMEQLQTQKEAEIKRLAEEAESEKIRQVRLIEELESAKRKADEERKAREALSDIAREQPQATTSNKPKKIFAPPSL